MNTTLRRSLLLMALLIAVTAPALFAPGQGRAQPRHSDCISNCVARRGTLDEIAAAMNDYHYGPKAITNWNEARVNWFEVQYRNGHKILRVHIQVATFPPAAPTRFQRRTTDCWWNFFDRACFQWNWPRVWDDVAGTTNTIGQTAFNCLAGSAHGFQGNLTKAEAGTLWFYSIGKDVTETPFLRASPAGLALGVLGQCIWGIYVNR